MIPQFKLLSHQALYYVHDTSFVRHAWKPRISGYGKKNYILHIKKYSGVRICTFNEWIVHLTCTFKCCCGTVLQRKCVFVGFLLLLSMLYDNYEIYNFNIYLTIYLNNSYTGNYNIISWNSYTYRYLNCDLI